MTCLGLHGVCDVNTRSALQIEAKTFDALLYHRQTFGETESQSNKLSDRRCWSLKPTSESGEAADNLTDHNCVSGDKVSGNVN